MGLTELCSLIVKEEIELLSPALKQKVYLEVGPELFLSSYSLLAYELWIGAFPFATD